VECGAAAPLYQQRGLNFQIDEIERAASRKNPVVTAPNS